MKQTNACKRDIKKARVKADLDFAIPIATVDGVMPSKKALEIIKSYSSEEIDYETAQLETAKLYKR